MKNLFPFMILLATGGCVTDVNHSNTPLTTLDKDTKYETMEQKRGFGLTIYYSRYEFVPDSTAVRQACKQIISTIAQRHADKSNKKIHPINKQRIRVSMKRNGITGITSCQAFVFVEYDVTNPWKGNKALNLDI